MKPQTQIQTKGSGIACIATIVGKTQSDVYVRIPAQFKKREISLNALCELLYSMGFLTQPLYAVDQVSTNNREVSWVQNTIEGLSIVRFHSGSHVLVHDQQVFDPSSTSITSLSQAASKHGPVQCIINVFEKPTSNSEPEEAVPAPVEAPPEPPPVEDEEIKEEAKPVPEIPEAPETPDVPPTPEVPEVPEEVPEKVDPVVEDKKKDKKVEKDKTPVKPADKPRKPKRRRKKADDA